MPPCRLHPHSTPGDVGAAYGGQPGKDYQAQRSGSYEGMALNPETGLLWAMLEKPLLVERGDTEGDFLRVMVFDPKAGGWTGDSCKSEGATAICDFSFIDATRALVIGRDNGGGDAAKACAEGAGPAT